MRKLVPFFLVSLAMTVSACGDDEGAIVPVDSPDSGGESTAAATEDAGGGDTTSEGGETTVAQTDDAAVDETSAAVELDAGSDGSTEPTTDVDGGETDSGVISVDAGDAAPATDVDGGGSSETDAGPVELTDCESACAAAAAKGCADNSTCEADICSVREYSANCVEEADAYLACIGATGTEEDFTCVDDKPTYTSEDCNDPYFDAWLACAFPQ